MNLLHDLGNQPWWPWVSLPTLLLLAWGLGSLLGKITRVVLTHITKRTTVTWDDTLVSRLAGPLTLAWSITLISLASPFLGWTPRMLAGTQRGVRLTLLLTFFWGLWRAVDVIRTAITQSKWLHDNLSSSALIPLGARISKVLVIVLAVAALLSDLGYPVASIVAGLGIGGLAVALAARSTLENLLGAFSIAADKPFQEGDLVKIDDFIGTVESIGLRSTRFRTYDRSVISLPNGKLADMRIESLAARDRLRLNCVVGLVYSTTSQQMRQVLDGMEAVLRGHAKIWPDEVTVRFSELADSSLNIEVWAWFQVRLRVEFQLIRQEILLGFMEVVEKAGTSFAFPTRTVVLHSETDNAPKSRA
jgi:MscS family membrane protein